MSEELQKLIILHADKHGMNVSTNKLIHDVYNLGASERQEFDAKIAIDAWIPNRIAEKIRETPFTN